MTKKKKDVSSRKRPIATGIYDGAELVGVSICLSKSEAKAYYDSVVGVYGIQRIEQLRDELDALIRRHRGT